MFCDWYGLQNLLSYRCALVSVFNQGSIMKIFYFRLVAMTAGASSFAQATLPDTPSLTIGAEMKGLRFDWEPVAGASWYQLEIKANENAEFVQHGGDLDA